MSRDAGRSASRKLPTTGGPPRKTARSAAAALFAAVLAFGILSTAGSVLPARAAETSTTDAAGVVELSVSAPRGAILRTGSDLLLTATISNGTAESIDAGVLQVRIDGQLADRSSIAAAMGEPDTVVGATVSTTATPDVAAGSTATVDLSIPAATISALLAPAGWGPHTLAATLDIPADPEISTASAVVWADGTAPSTLDTAVVVPVTVAPGQDGVLTADELTAATSADGSLTRKLDALATSPNAIIALDPRIIASIRVLGTAAPASSLDWLGRLAGLPNSVFPLQYADADLSIERAAGVAGPLSATSLAWALDPTTFGTADTTTAPTTAPTPGSTPPTGQPIPTLDELLRWNWTRTDIAWPSADSLSAADVPFFTGAGFSRLLVSSDNLAGGTSSTGSLTPESVQTLGDATALVVDSGVSEALSTAAFSDKDAASQEGLALATAQLAAIAVERPGRTSTVLMALDRAAEPSTAGLSTALATLRTLPGTTDAGLGALSSSSATAAADLRDASRPGADIVESLLDLDARIVPYASVIAQPELLIGRERTRLLAVLSAGWASDPEGWQAAAEETRLHFDDVLHSVTVLPGSPIIAAGQFDTVPIYVRNNLGYAVEVLIDPRPSNGRIIMQEYTATIEPGESQRVFLPAKWIANGTLSIAITLSSASTGLQVDGPTYVSLDVQTYWETAVYIVTGVLVVALFGFGIYRNVVRRRRLAAGARARASIEASDDTPTPDGTTR